MLGNAYRSGCSLTLPTATALKPRMKSRRAARRHRLSMNRTGKLLGVSTPTIQAWIEQFAKVYGQKPEPAGRAVAVELDEMWHYLRKSRTSCGSGRLGIVLQGSSWTGNAAVVTPLPPNA